MFCLIEDELQTQHRTSALTKLSSYGPVREHRGAGVTGGVLVLVLGAGVTGRVLVLVLGAGVTGRVLVLVQGAGVTGRVLVSGRGASSAVRLGHSGHGHVGAVDEEDEDGQQADQRTQHAEADDSTTTQVETLHDVAPQEGAPPAGRDHHDAWRGEEGEG